MAGTEGCKALAGLSSGAALEEPLAVQNHWWGRQASMKTLPGQMHAGFLITRFHTSVPHSRLLLFFFLIMFWF